MGLFGRTAQPATVSVEMWDKRTGRFIGGDALIVKTTPEAAVAEANKLVTDRTYKLATGRASNIQR